MALWRQDDRFDPVPTWLLDAVNRGLHDLQQPTVVDLRLGLDPDEQHLWLYEADGSGSGFNLSWRGRRNLNLVVDFADFLVEQVFAETSEAWAEPRPQCPGHPHPASADQLDDEAWWICPSDGHRVAVIGRFGLSGR